MLAFFVYSQSLLPVRKSFAVQGRFLGWDGLGSFLSAGGLLTAGGFLELGGLVETGGFGFEAPGKNF